VCDATQVDVVINNTATVRTAYGTERGDTNSVCGDINNGFGLLINWNLLGDGVHTIRTLADGVEFGSATFTVTTLGEEFLPGIESRTTLENFPESGTDITLEWQESLQNFVIVEVEGGTPPPPISSDAPNDGSWTGTVIGGGTVSFTVQSGGTELASGAKVEDIPFTCSSCTGMETVTFNSTISINNNSFSSSGLDGLLWTGDFLSSTFAEGTYEHGPFTIPRSSCGTCVLSQKNWSGFFTGSASSAAMSRVRLPATVLPLEAASTGNREWYFDPSEDCFYALQRAADGTLIRISEFRLNQ
jgi:hypothetical protein